MEDKLHRRSFISRLSLAVSAALTAPLTGTAKAIKENYQTAMEKDNPVLRVKPMGFQWETLDPFLFC
ncbi:MAG TPA: pirin family protein, partial [Bacteroidia bacterium]|nr:pirin family protein [Bacteroidia bacterium]